MYRRRLLFALILLPLILSAAEPPPQAIGVFFSPNGGCTEAVVREIALAAKSVRIQAYSFTSVPIAKAIVEAHQRGVKVEAILDKSNRTDRYTAATFLKNQKIDVLIDARHAIAHNKIMLIDDAVIITGSFNFTENAEKSNAENLLIIREHPDLVRKYLANYENHKAHSLVYERPPGTEGEPEKREGHGDGPADQQTGSDKPEGGEADHGDAAVKFVGSRDSDVYHYPTCSEVRKIRPENLVKYKSAPEGKHLHKGCPR